MEREKYITQQTEGSSEAVRLKNQIQIDLARRKGMEVIEWIQKYSDDFRQLFHNEIIRDPHLLKHDEQTHQATLDLFEAALYKDEKSETEKLVDKYGEFEEAA